MENEPLNPLNPYRRPEETGSEKASSKKKKRSTKVPLGRVINDESKTPVEEVKAEDYLTQLFAKTEKESEKPEKSVEVEEPDHELKVSEYSEAYDESGLAELSGVENVVEKPPIETPTEPIDDEYIEFVAEESDEEPLIFSRENEPVVESKHPDEEVVIDTAYESSKTAEVQIEPALQSADSYEHYVEPDIHWQAEQTGQESGTRRTSETPNLIPESDVSDMVHQAKKEAVRKGVITGGLFGWWIGRRGKKEAKEAAKQAQAENRELNKKITSLEFEQSASKERIMAIELSSEYLGEALLEKRADTGSVKSFKDNQEITLEKSEASNDETKVKPTPENQEITEEMYLKNKDRRVETSAWHSYEVDAKTGHIVNDPERVYGQEFVNELRQEKLGQHKDPGLAVQFGHSVVQSANESEARKSGKLQSNKQSFNQYLEAAKQQAVVQAKNPSIWIAAGIIFVLLLIFGLLT